MLEKSQVLGFLTGYETKVIKKNSDFTEWIRNVEPVLKKAYGN